MKNDLPHEPHPVFFVDRDLDGNIFTTILKNAGIPIERHQAHFVHNVPDHEWIAEAGKHGWYVLTHDKMIRHRIEELNAVEKNNVGMFILVGKASHAELANGLVAMIQKVVGFIRKNNRPFIAKIYRPAPAKKDKLKPSGQIVMWKSFRGER